MPRGGAVTLSDVVARTLTLACAQPKNIVRDCRTAQLHFTGPLAVRSVQPSLSVFAACHREVRAWL
jgi:hypothetical protein